MNVLQRLVAIMLVGSAAFAAMPTAAADYGCASYPLVRNCSGIDKAEDCFGENADYHWGFDTQVFGGLLIAIGGTHACKQSEGGTNETTHMDAGVYTPISRTGVFFDEFSSHSGDTLVESYCTMTVQVSVFAIGRAVQQPCIVSPVHPGLLLP